MCRCVDGWQGYARTRVPLFPPACQYWSCKNVGQCSWVSSLISSIETSAHHKFTVDFGLSVAARVAWCKLWAHCLWARTDSSFTEGTQCAKCPADSFSWSSENDTFQMRKAPGGGIPCSSLRRRVSDSVLLEAAPLRRLLGLLPAPLAGVSALPSRQQYQRHHQQLGCWSPGPLALPRVGPFVQHATAKDPCRALSGVLTVSDVPCGFQATCNSGEEPPPPR